MRVYKLLQIIPALFLFSCADQIKESVPTIFDTTEPVSITPEFSSIQKNVFTPLCATSRCHDGLQAPNLSEGLAYNNIVNILNTQVSGLSRVKPGNPNNSYLYLKLINSSIEGSRMPIDSPPLSRSATDSIRVWIERGAPQN